MAVNNSAASGMALAFGGSMSPPNYIAIGNGSGADSASIGSLMSETGLRIIYTTRDIATQKKTTYTFDYNSVQMSGLSLREFGQFSSSGAGIGIPWNREPFTAISFDGTNDLRVQIEWTIY